ncbi:uncharacterized protein GGS22DRAFT_69151 [Annulohypoxylon maeteangense]|uniref:uncharacterized protein n=1 Tax=Annulohypoxylon maeteangense TaxID=1927788 RepID=UPI002007B055|nr:uncharacterized protein GGS22DRAFT_69151 [Annulohypoxylon maeteangense]KAI0889252.1 hypothetical protein GGS22DRAFT_69151 [Annulohypoxylon maeteangense]
MMNTLPTEIVIQIIEWTAVVYYGDKNMVLELRKVCKLFDEILRPIAFCTLPIDYTRVDYYQANTRAPLKRQALRRIAPYCQSLFIDMMVVRDDGECQFLENAFAPIPKMKEWVSNLREWYCMNEDTFTPMEYRAALEMMLNYTPNTTSMKLNLPFQLVACGLQYRASTMILGNTFDLLANRREGSKELKTLSLENLSDISIGQLWGNPSDVKNIIKTFGELNHLSLSLRRHWVGQAPLWHAHRLWEMICKAGKLESLCLIDLDVGDTPRPAKLITTKATDSTHSDWEYRSLPLIVRPPKSFLPNLTYLELRNLNIKADALVCMFKNFANCLQELYLDNVYLKTTYCIEWSLAVNYGDLWIGLPNKRPRANQRWLATYLRQIRAQLRVCRATNLGYDRFVRRGIIEAPAVVKYDISDPCGLDRTIEQRFVEVFMGYEQPNTPEGLPVVYLPRTEAQDAWAMADRKRPTEVNAEDWDASLYPPAKRHPTSTLQKSIDGKFANYNPWTLRTLRYFANRTSEGLKELNNLRMRERQENQENQENQESQD